MGVFALNKNSAGMTTKQQDKAFLKIMLAAQKANIKIYGDKPCKSIAIGCANCEAQLLIAYLDKQIVLMKWVLKKK